MSNYIRAVAATVSFACLSACSGGGTADSGASITPQTLDDDTADRTTLAITAPQLVTPVRAATFVDSVGVNTHWNYPVYSRSFAYLKGLLVAGGIRHIRDGFSTNPAQTPAYIANLRSLQSSGIRATMSTLMNMSVNTIAQNVQALPGFVEAIEAPNEYDFSGDPLWAVHLASYQQALYRGVKANSRLTALPVIGPAFGWASSYAQLGNISPYMDQGNMHNYFSGFNPGTLGYGGGGFGSVYGTIKYNIGAAAQASGTKPVVSTETGYCTIPGTRNAVSPLIQGKYMPRLYLEQWLAKVSRTLQYELLDEGGSGCNGTLGLVTGSYTPKPAYYALRSMLTTLADANSSFQPTAINLAVNARVASVHRLLLQKSNGIFVLALWNEVPSWDVNNGTGTPITPVPIKVRIKLDKNPSTSKLSSIVDDGSIKNSAIAWQKGAANLTIDDHVTLMTFTR